MTEAEGYFVPVRQQVNKGLPAGTIIMPTSDISRYPQCWMCLMGLQAPVGSQIYVPLGIDLAANLNSGLRALHGEWAFIMGDDHAFPPDMLLRHLVRGKDIISSLCAKRRPPFEPLILGDHTDDGLWQAARWQDLPAPDELFNVKVTGSAGMLIRKHVLEKVGDPWFEVGRIKRDSMTEDAYFQDKVRAAGFDILVDPTNLVGHFFTACVWPRYDRETKRWGPVVDLGDRRLHDMGMIGGPRGEIAL